MAPSSLVGGLCTGSFPVTYFSAPPPPLRKCGQHRSLRFRHKLPRRFSREWRVSIEPRPSGPALHRKQHWVRPLRAKFSDSFCGRPRERRCLVRRTQILASLAAIVCQGLSHRRHGPGARPAALLHCALPSAQTL